ncbi:MAG TPA: SBBP repeat-containing protein [Candidatus Dormibacteraeota bacterium]|nr:SBBP repeat-containing protein [Candidatus Dormibacteraeota bacterium]
MHERKLLGGLLWIRLAILSLAIVAAVSASRIIHSFDGSKSYSKLAHSGTIVPRSPSDATTKIAVSESYGKLPLSFEANVGQTSSQVKFLSRGQGYTLFLTPSGEAVLALRKSVPKRDPLKPTALVSMPAPPIPDATGPLAIVRMKLVGANAKPRVEALDELPGKANYLIGNDPKKWRTNVPLYAKVRYREVYPGVDLVYYGNQRQLEHDFIVAPGADPRSITLNLAGAEKLSLDPQGALVLAVKDGELRMDKPRIYQEVDGARREISGGYVLKSAYQVGFQIAAYDATRLLIIDPTLFYSTYLGGNSTDVGQGIAVDAAGNAYVTGYTTSINFPTTVGTFQTANGGSYDAFVTKLNPTGTAPLVYSTYLGGSNFDLGYGIAVDNLGNAYVTGYTCSSNFPTTPLAFQTALQSFCDAFVTKLNPAGSAPLYSTYLGGNSADFGQGIAVDSTGSAYVTGYTYSSNFPTTPGAFQTTFAGGYHAFVTKLNPTGTAPLVYSTYLGGNSTDVGQGIAVDAAGNAYVTGVTCSTNFPTTPGAFQTANASGGCTDAFVTKLNPVGSAPLVYSTYLGGFSADYGQGIVVDSTGSAYVTGYTNSSNFPTTLGAFQAANQGGFDAFVTALNPLGTAPLVYSTYLGGSNLDYGQGIAVDSTGSAYVTGYTDSSNFPTTPGAFQTANASGGCCDAFVAKITGFPATQTEQCPPSGEGNCEQTAGGGDVNDNQNNNDQHGQFSFLVRRPSTTQHISGGLQYVSSASGTKLQSVTLTSLVITGNTATFAGTCTNNGAPCVFVANVTDSGPLGSADLFTISISGGPTRGGTLRSGKIQIRPR